MQALRSRFKAILVPCMFYIKYATFAHSLIFTPMIAKSKTRGKNKTYPSPVSVNTTCAVCCQLRQPSKHTKTGAGQCHQSFLRRKVDFDASARLGCHKCSAVVRSLENLDLSPQFYQSIVIILYETGECYLRIPGAGITLQFYTPIGKCIM